MKKFINLSDSVQDLKGVGPQRAQRFKKLGVETAEDLVRYFPRAWQDRRHLTEIRAIESGVITTLCGLVRRRSTFRMRSNFNITSVVLEDNTGRIEATWFNQPYMRNRFQDGQRVMVHGKVEFNRTWRIMNPEYEILDEETENSIHTGRIVPIYPLTEKLTQRVLRSTLYDVLAQLPQPRPEILPATVVRKNNFPSPGRAISDIHFPPNFQARDQARQRLVWEELLLQQLAVGRLRHRYQQSEGTALKRDGAGLEKFNSHLPFTLTSAQVRARDQIFYDLASARPMHRLLQGDVGSGKTIIAVLAMLLAVDSGRQAALMAPTEVLAAQHYMSIKQLLDPCGVNMELITSGSPAPERRRINERLAGGEINIAVGTHALIQQSVVFNHLALAVIDEQHRFGVEQRAMLRSKGRQPHVLVMTATPIPRTLSMTVYGDLDVTTINELPPGRRPVQTKWLARADSRIAYEKAARAAESGRQVYVIFPLIEESEKVDLKALNSEYEHLGKMFKGRKLGLLHGRMKACEKEKVMMEFRAGEIEILAATTVVEVGVDVPNATVMLIENADRFGLAQLHQLRGRIGRGGHEGFCFLIADPATPEGKARLEIMTRITDGFQLAEEDMTLRGPGEFFGLRQHGLPEFKLADLSRDAACLVEARKTAQEIIRQDPDLQKPENRELGQVYDDIYGERESRVRSG